ncbi:MAG TPA: hypothetical protein VHB30_02995 [Solirubrobacteraceae bacterium]|nr:hypothetical protein [Solirubrobacteraceae bacterium]
MTRAAGAVFALLAAATFAAFFVAQRLKHEPTAIQGVRVHDALFSPTCGCEKRALRASFRVKRDEDVTVEVIDREGDVVRTLVRDRTVRAYRRIPTMSWDGATDAGARAPDGGYRLRVTLHREGRTIVVPRALTLDTTPPRPRVRGIGPNHLLPNDVGRVRISLGQRAGAYGRLLIFRTAPGAPRLMTELPLRKGAVRASWSGRAKGRQVPAGTYLVVARWRDSAGNVGSSVPLDAHGLPVLPYGTGLRGHGGVTVRHLEIEPPRVPARPGQEIAFGVDARGDCFRWSIHRLGNPEVVRRGRSCHTPLDVHAPGEESGVYLFEAHTATHRAEVPFAVQAAKPAKALVVLPLLTWQGRNPVDDDGDGAPDTLDRGVASATARVLAGGRLPHGFAAAEGPLLAFLQSRHRRFDVTTDYALATGTGPALAGHTGVVLPGDVRWLPNAVSVALRDFARLGGRVLEIGTGSLRRGVALSSHGTLHRPTAAAPSDVFGARLRPVVHAPTTVTNATDSIRLFAGTVTGGTGVFSGFPGYEALAAPGPRLRPVATATTSGGATVIVAARYGRGLVIRTGLLGFATHLRSDDDAAQLVLRSMDLLDGGS